MPMTQEEAFKLACEKFGDGAAVGVNGHYPHAPFFVGAKSAFDRWRVRGVGASFEEAFANVDAVDPKTKRPLNPWPDGEHPEIELRAIAAQATATAAKASRK